MSYQNIVDSIRYRENYFAEWNGGGWRGHTGSARSKYPNLAAELDARDWEIKTAVNAAHVSHEVMAGVIEDGDDLEPLEIARIAQRLGVGSPYLRAPVLSMVDPSTNKGKFKARILERLLKQSKEYGVRLGQTGVNAWATLIEMKRGHPVTYASYAWFTRRLEEELDEYERDHCCCIRTERKEAAQ